MKLFSKLKRVDLRETVGVALLSCLFSIIFTFPAITHLSTAFIGDGYDNYEYAAYQSLAAQNIRHLDFPFQFTTYFRYPVGFDFARGFDSYISVLLGAFLNLFVSLPTSYNLSILLLLTFNGLCAYLMGKMLTKSRVLGVISMLMYGFSFYTLAKSSSHPNLLFTGGVTLLVWALTRLLELKRLRSRDIGLVGLAIVIIAAGSLLYTLYLLIFSGLILLVSLLFYPKQIEALWKKLTKKPRILITPILLTLGAVLLLYFPQIKAMINHTYVTFSRADALDELTPSLTDYILPNPYLHLQISRFVTSLSAPSIEKAVFVGWIELILFCLFFVSGLPGKLKAFIGTLFAIPLVLSFGYGTADSFPLLPYRMLSQEYPFNVLVETGRYFVVFYLFFTISVLLLLQSLKNDLAKKVLLSLVIVLLIAERLPHQFYQASPLKDSYVQKVADSSSTAVLDLPINYYYPPYDVLSMYYQKPIVNGYFHWSADGDQEKSFITKDNLLSRYICDSNDPITTEGLNEAQEAKEDAQMLQMLKDQGITTIVVHKDDKFYHPVCTNVRLRLDRLINGALVLQPTTLKELQLASSRTQSKPTYTLSFPQNGTLYLDGVYLDTNPGTTFSIVQNNTPVTFTYSWDIDKTNWSMQLTPKYKIHVPVTADSTLSFVGNGPSQNSYFSLWYRYIPASSSASLTPPLLHLTKIYEDEKVSIFRL